MTVRLSEPGETCALCDGSGKKYTVIKDKRTGLSKWGCTLCACKKSEIVSQNYPYLGYLDRKYLPEEDLHKDIVFNPIDLSSSPNLLIIGSSWDFRLHLKTIIMKYRFLDPAPAIYCCSSIDILQKFYVKQNDGSSPQLSSTDKFDLLAFALDNFEKNEQLKTCIAQVVYMRKNKKPTWILQPHRSLVDCKWEYSLELQELLESYKKIILGECLDSPVDSSKKSVSENDAANFTR